MILLFSSFYFSSNWSVIYIQRHKAVSVHVFLAASTLSTTDLHYSFTNTYYCFPLHRTVPQSGQTLQSTEGNIAVNRREHCSQQKGTLQSTEGNTANRPAMELVDQWKHSVSMWLTSESIQSVCTNTGTKTRGAKRPVTEAAHHRTRAEKCSAVYFTRTKVPVVKYPPRAVETNAPWLSKYTLLLNGTQS